MDHLNVLAKFEVHSFTRSREIAIGVLGDVRTPILEKRECGRIQGLPKFFGYPILFQEREKLQIWNLASTFRWSIRTKAH